MQFSQTLSRARKTQNNHMPMPRLICGRLTSLNVSRVHRFPLTRHIGLRNFGYGGQIKRDAVLLLGSVRSRNIHRSILGPVQGQLSGLRHTFSDFPTRKTKKTKKKKRRAAHSCSPSKHTDEAGEPEVISSQQVPPVPPLLVYAYPRPCTPTA